LGRGLLVPEEKKAKFPMRRGKRNSLKGSTFVCNAVEKKKEAVGVRLWKYSGKKGKKKKGICTQTSNDPGKKRVQKKGGSQGPGGAPYPSGGGGGGGKKKKKGTYVRVPCRGGTKGESEGGKKGGSSQKRTKREREKG